MRSLGLAERIPAGRKSGALAAIAVVFRKDRRFVVGFDVMQTNVTAANGKGKRKIAPQNSAIFNHDFLGIKVKLALAQLCSEFRSRIEFSVPY